MDNTKTKQSQEALSELRKLLFDTEINKIEELKQKLDDPEVFSKKISHVLPQAMNQSAQQGEALSEAMIPTVEEIVRLSIKKDINKFANALFPVIGPAIRKSITETLKHMLQSLNQVLEHAFSWRGIKWRIESLRTGIPFAQIVLLNSFSFRVDQVFLIHRKSGLLLHSVEQDDALSLHADMVSAMLTAIGDFVKDSFQVANKQALDNIQLGDFSILIEQGPDLILAVACRGEVSKELRKTMVHIIEHIQARFAHDLEHFKGDTHAFEATHEQLLSCLSQTQQQPNNPKTSLKTKFVLVVLFILIGYWVFNKTYLSIQQHNYVNLLNQQPGLIITQTHYGSDVLNIQGFQDPLAQDPLKLIHSTKLKPEQVQLKFEPYQSFHNTFVKKRIQRIIQPGDNMHIHLNQGTLRLTGFASQQKINSIRLIAPLITGVTHVDSSALSSDINLDELNAPNTVNMTLDIDKGILHLTGEAKETWLDTLQQRALAIKGIQQIDLSRVKPIPDLSIFHPPASITLQLRKNVLHIQGSADTHWLKSVKTSLKNHPNIQSLNLTQFTNTDKTAFNDVLNWIQQQTIFFDSALSFSLEKQQQIENITQKVLHAIQLAKILEYDFTLIIQGYSDSIGSHQDNVFLSFERAEFVAQYLLNAGVNPRYIQIKGIKQPVKTENSIEQRAFNRRVTFTAISKQTLKNRKAKQ